MSGYDCRNECVQFSSKHWRRRSRCSVIRKTVPQSLGHYLDAFTLLQAGLMSNVRNKWVVERYVQFTISTVYWVMGHVVIKTVSRNIFRGSFLSSCPSLSFLSFSHPSVHIPLIFPPRSGSQLLKSSWWIWEGLLSPPQRGRMTFAATRHIFGVFIMVYLSANTFNVAKNPF